MENNQSRPRAIDIEFLRSIIENDVEFEKELFSIFVENANRNFAKMEETLGKDNQGWYMSSHAFKGAAASVGAFELSRILEGAQKAMELPAEQKSQILAQAREEFKLVLEFINEELLEK
jgi:HPt (histidine-containing phosphotransfer) domain-containing protein